MGSSQQSSRRSARLPGKRSAFTLVEALVAVFVIGLLISIALPAVLAAREAGRRAHCQNNLRQLGLASLQHVAAQGHYPTNGWGYAWVGDPDRGFGSRQPGGWIFNVLPWLEATAVRELGRGLPLENRPIAFADRNQRDLPVLICPSRRGPGLLPATAVVTFRNAVRRDFVAKADYAICEGDYVTNTGQGPQTLVEGDRREYAWTDVRRATGVSFLRSMVRPAEVAAGESNTYLLGEKSVSDAALESDQDLGFDQSCYSGVDVDLNRWTIDPPTQDDGHTRIRRFGSPHSGGCGMVFCDGSVRMVSYGVDGELHRRAGTRDEGA